MKNTKLIALLVCLTVVVCSFAGCTMPELPFELPFDVSNIPLIGDLFVKTASVEFDAADGEIVGEVPAAYSDNADLALPEASLQYYAFKGWSLNADGTGDLYTEFPAKFALTDEQIELGIVFYAVYERLSGNIAYDLAGGEWVDAEGPASYLYGEIVELPEVEKDRFEFVAWTLNDEVVENITESQEGDVTLVATWKQVETEIAFVLNKDTASLPDAGDRFDTEDGVDLSKEKYIPSAPASIFTGWFFDAEFTQLATEIPGGTLEAVTLYARWETAPAIDGDNWLPAN